MPGIPIIPGGAGAKPVVPAAAAPNVVTPGVRAVPVLPARGAAPNVQMPVAPNAGVGGSRGFAKGGSADTKYHSTTTGDVPPLHGRAPARPASDQIDRSALPDKGIGFDKTGNPQDYAKSAAERSAGADNPSPGDVMTASTPTQYANGGVVGDTKARYTSTVHKDTYKGRRR